MTILFLVLLPSSPLACAGRDIRAPRWTIQEWQEGQEEKEKRAFSASKWSIDWQSTAVRLERLAGQCMQNGSDGMGKGCRTEAVKLSRSYPTYTEEEMR